MTSRCVCEGISKEDKCVGQQTKWGRPALNVDGHYPISCGMG
jgi:hypothetical protein